MKLTEFLKLKLPSYEETADIEVLDENFQTLDDYIKESTWKIDFKDIPYNSDLNDYTTPGRYKQYQNQSVSGILNSPNAMAFTLKVVSIGGGWSTQTFTTYTSERVYIRSYNGSSWSKWYEFYTTKNFNPDTKEDAFPKKSGFNLDKTDLTENDSNKVFTPKGALNLFNTLTTNFTNAINTAKEALRLDIVKKVSKNGDTMSAALRFDSNHMILYKDTYKGVYASDMNIGFTTSGNDWAFYIDSNNNSIATGEIYANRNQKVYHPENKPTTADIGAEPAFSKKSGFNLDKTDLIENDSNKVLTPKGAFDLKNWLVTNYTTLMNNIKSVLDNDIATKLPHGGYGQTAQQLKNEVDEAPQKIRWINIPNGSDLNDYRIPGRFRIYDNGQVLNSPTGHAFNLDVLSVGGEWITHIITTYVGRSYMRFYNPGNKTWSAWGENYTNLTLPRSSSITSDSENDIATSKAVKTLNDSKFDKSGGNITNSINVGGAGTFYNAYVKKYFYIYDYYDGPQTAKIWFNKENSAYPSNTLFFDDITDLYVGRSKVLNQRNSGVTKETLFSGTVNKTTNSILTKPITDYDLIYFYSGDSIDAAPHIFLPEDMMSGLGSRGIFQIRYFDSNGGDSVNDAQWDAGYFKMYSSTALRFMYDYSGRLYVSDGYAKDVKVVGIKFNFGNR